VRLSFCGGRWVEHSAQGLGGRGESSLRCWFESLCAVWECFLVEGRKRWRSIYIQVFLRQMNGLLILF
jgi:hypothetical protein